jgi:hypothetical protein
MSISTSGSSRSKVSRSKPYDPHVVQSNLPGTVEVAAGAIVRAREQQGPAQCLVFWNHILYIYEYTCSF